MTSRFPCLVDPIVCTGKKAGKSYMFLLSNGRQTCSIPSKAQTPVTDIVLVVVVECSTTDICIQSEIAGKQEVLDSFDIPVSTTQPCLVHTHTDKKHGCVYSGLVSNESLFTLRSPLLLMHKIPSMHNTHRHSSRCVCVRACNFV
jgi:hypothetical protein